MNDPNKRVLIVDDEFLIAEGLSMQVQAMGLEVCAIAGTAEEAIAESLAHRPRLVLMDMRLRGQKDGVDAALAIHEAHAPKMIFITGSGDPNTLTRIQSDHPSAVLLKPVSERRLKATIEAVLTD